MSDEVNGQVRHVVTQLGAKFLTVPAEGCRLGDLGEYNEGWEFNNKLEHQVRGLPADADTIVNPGDQIISAQSHSNG